MHDYSTDSMERRTVPRILFLISIGLAYGLSRVLAGAEIEWLWLVDIPSVIGFYSLLDFAFEKWIWQWSLLRKLGLVQVPNVTGIWEGELTSSYDEHKATHRIKITIRQTWSRILISLESESSKSNSRVASVLVSSSNGFQITHEYLNEPKPDALKTMHTHQGTCRLWFSENSLEGDYYTGRDRQNYGRIRVKKAEAVRPQPLVA